MRAALNANLSWVIDLPPSEEFVMVHPLVNAKYPIRVSGATVHPEHIFIVATRVVGPGQLSARAGFVIDHDSAMKASFPDSFRAVLYSARMELEALVRVVRDSRLAPHEPPEREPEPEEELTDAGDPES